VLSFLTTEGSRVLEKKENETQVPKLCLATLNSHLNFMPHGIAISLDVEIENVFVFQAI